MVCVLNYFDSQHQSQTKTGRNGERLKHLHPQDTSKLQCVEDFLEGMLGKLKFE